jgi:hypothetical protein
MGWCFGFSKLANWAGEGRFFRTHYTVVAEIVYREKMGTDQGGGVRRRLLPSSVEC